MMRRTFASVLAILLVVACAAQQPEVRVIERIPVDQNNPHYLGNRAPLRHTPLTKLPPGAIKPHGWLLAQLRLMADGFVGRLGEISRWLKKDGNAWLSSEGVGHSNWEELPYWLKGFGELAYVLGDEKLIAEAKVWIDGTIASQRADGYFGPRENLLVIQTDDGKKPDLWPNMVMLNVLQSYYEFRGDDRVIRLMQRYFKWQLDYPEKDFLLPYWQQQRAADNLASVYWLYNRTGEGWLLDLAQKIHRRTANWTDGVANWHGVNISQSFRGPAVFWQQSGEERHLRAPYATYETVMNEYGQVPGGMFAADENARRGFFDPRQAAESCTMVELMYSFEQLLSITSDPLWADRCEDVAFNSLPAAMMADWKGLRYLTSPNMISSDARSKAPGYENGGPMQLMDPRDHRCCQHNVAHGWPYFAEHLWMATPDGGLAATLYAPSEVTAKVGVAGANVTLRMATRYPFREEVELHVSLAAPAAFPLYARIPAWCANDPGTGVTINGALQPYKPGAGGRWIRIERTWADGDLVKLRFPMREVVKRWRKNGDSLSIYRGPLAYSLQLDEEYTSTRPDDKWGAWEIRTKSPWNYGLLAERQSSALPDRSFELQPWPEDDQPFTAKNPPVTLSWPGRLVAGWSADHLGLVGRLQASPAASESPTKQLTLIPMGCARLRITAFPEVKADGSGNPWTPPPMPRKSTPATASHCYSEDTLTALDDGLEPQDSNDYNVPRFTWWPRRGSEEWVQYDFEKLRKLSKVAVYWFDDSGRGRCRTPAAWKLLYKPVGAAGGQEWREIKPIGPADSAFGTQRDRYNELSFEPVETTALRIIVQLKPEFSGGILEWRFE